jgi:hypothetical protein
MSLRSRGDVSSVETLRTAGFTFRCTESFWWWYWRRVVLIEVVGLLVDVTFLLRTYVWMYTTFCVCLSISPSLWMNVWIGLVCWFPTPIYLKLRSPFPISHQVCTHNMEQVNKTQEVPQIPIHISCRSLHRRLGLYEYSRETRGAFWSAIRSNFPPTSKAYSFFRILSSHSGGYEEYYLLGYNVV